MNESSIYDFDKRRIIAPKKELLSELKTFYRFNKMKPISKSAYNRWAHRRFSGETISRCFGSWENACQEAGIKFAKKHYNTDKELIEHFDRIWIWREQRPVQRDLKEYKKKNGTTLNPVLYERRWGTYMKFVNLFQRYKNGQITYEKLIESKKPKSQRRTISPSDRVKVLKRDNHTCQNCGRSRRTYPDLELEVHHIIPVSKGGKNELSNLITHCRDCNRGKSNKILV